MPTVNSPLRYPGGKAVLSEFLASVIESNGLADGIYAEPFAGGAGAALNLLFSGHVGRIKINDADLCVYAFWKAVLSQTSRFLSLLEETPVTIEEWHRQREIYRNASRQSNIRLGFATFYLNRCNRSGILMNAGPIGGFDQTGKWKIDARFNKEDQARRIERICLFKDAISVFNLDAIDFLKNEVVASPCRKETLVYLDPPYYVKGSKLYLNHYKHQDHAQLARFVRRMNCKWVMSYDNVAEVRELYGDMSQMSFDLNYSAHSSKVGSELLIYNSSKIIMPVKTEILSRAS